MKAVVKVDIVDGKCVVIYSDGSEQELYEYPSDEGGGGGSASLLDEKLITHNGEYSASSDGYDGYKKVNVNVVAPAPELMVKEITSNGTYNADDDHVYGYAKVIVNVQGSAELTNAILSRTVTQIEKSDLTVLGEYALCNCKSLISAVFPNVTTVYSEVFNACNNLVEVSLPKANGQSDYITGVFKNCSKIETIVLPAWSKTFYSQFFDSCSKLTTIDTRGNNISGSNVFKNCTLLNKLILRKTSLVGLSAIGHFSGTPFASNGSGGTLYVPNALISTYQGASIWSTILGYANNNIVAIEGSQYENYYADGTAIT